ncbi:LacI family transcriptional regulator [Prevotella lacticifex]|uniref:LacI family transcriptional regulator n=3 Tax=Prevotella TaxID=838 RepID=A0A9R1CYC9_9BACT|nr:LacI family transcriptional regulator [Prevotella lacticifex]GJG38490.1 LacI family transcriptional regulator [Prevotella lacticifex]GJG42827.1 LacI family transcriptional regulator [Prevotella lacticifex]GJG44847.1 LacI family transcriptional regulator [Prevotella lacticifex]GJG49178.1 LacI family transcriptional regulator [Prevotella lacticifex]
MKMKQNSPITMKDIARDLGVSVATVSRALKDSPRISEAKRKEIQEYARDHNFLPNVIAETLRKSRVQPNKVIGVIVPQFIHYYFASILKGVEEEASRRGYRIMVAQSDDKYEREVEICKSFYANKCCGIIVSMAKNTTKYDHFQKLIDMGIPLVFYDRICTGVNASRVVVDDYMGAYTAVTHLIDTGCRKIAYYGMVQSMEIDKNRFNGYEDALRKHGLKPNPDWLRKCDNRADAEVVTPEILAQPDHPDAFFAINDDTAIGILYSAKKMGFDVPDDISICGFTNGNRAKACNPMLTTVEQRGVMVGEEAANILIGQVEGSLPMDKVEKRVVRTRLIIRGTTR